MGLLCCLPVSPSTIILTALLGLILYLYMKGSRAVFSKLDVPGPNPWPIFGNSLAAFSKSMLDVDMDYRKTYGKLVGIFEGSSSVLLIFDPTLLKEAYIKNFTKTTNRRRMQFGGVLDSGLVVLEDDHWKHVRSILSPSFAQGKLKQMIPAIQKCDETFVEVLKKAGGDSLYPKSKVNALTLATIAATAFGIEIDSQTNPDSPFIQNAMKLRVDVLPDSLLAKIKIAVSNMLIFFAPKFISKALQKLGLGIFDQEAIGYFEDICKDVIQMRQTEGSMSHDFVQSLSDKVVCLDENDPDTHRDNFGNLWTKKGLTRMEVMGNALFFFLAGFQTTADSMLSLLFELAHHPEYQEKMLEEINSVCDDGASLTMEDLSKMKYVECCINESLRLYPAAIRIERVVTEEFQLEGRTIPKGMVIATSGFVCHRDPELWDRPDDFYPERFLPGNSPDASLNAFMPFGVGNRSCIGSRLALLNMKLALIAVIKSFRIESGPKNPVGGEGLAYPVKCHIAVFLCISYHRI